MQKSLSDVAKYLQSLILDVPVEPYEFKAFFLDFNKEEMIQGLFDFRQFLKVLFQNVSDSDNLFKPQKEAHAFTDRTSLTTSYPFLSDVKNILLAIGVFGKLEDGFLALKGEQLLACETLKDTSKSIRGKTIKIIDTLRFFNNE